MASSYVQHSKGVVATILRRLIASSSKSPLRGAAKSLRLASAHSKRNPFLWLRAVEVCCSKCGLQHAIHLYSSLIDIDLGTLLLSWDGTKLNRIGIDCRSDRCAISLGKSGAVRSLTRGFPEGLYRHAVCSPEPTAWLLQCQKTPSQARASRILPHGGTFCCSQPCASDHVGVIDRRASAVPEGKQRPQRKQVRVFPSAEQDLTALSS